MEWVETTGKTIEEAKEAALDQLGVDESDAEFVVVSEPKAGLFGRMRGEARVRARVRPTAPRPKRGRSRRSGEESRRQGGSRSGRGGRSGEGGSKQGQKAATAVADGDADDDDGEGAGANGSTAAAAAAGDPGAPGTGTGPRKRRRRGGRGRSGGSNGSGGTGAGAGGNGGARPQRSNGDGAEGRTRQDNKGNEEETVEQVLTLEEQGESARRFVEGVVREMGLTADVGVRLVDEDTAEVTVGGEELGLLIGPGGATLSALQEITRTVVQRHTGGHSDRIIVDVAGYRAKRAEALAKFATKVADEVITASEERALEPMSPADRKVVHDTANEIDGVSTRSEGEEPRRYVVISPTQSPAPATESSASIED